MPKTTDAPSPAANAVKPTQRAPRPSDTKGETGGSGVQWVTVSESHAGQRIDNFLMRELKGVPRAHVYRIIRRGDVRIDKKRCKPERKLRLGEQVRVPPYSGAEVQQPGPLSPALKQRLLDLVLTENDDYLVINKPSGMAVHGGSGIRLGLIEAVRQVSAAWQHTELAHRLDRETSGCLLIAKNARFLKFAQDQFRGKGVRKEYLALVAGTWPSGVKSVDANLKKDALGEGERIVRVSPEGKAALTRFEIERSYAEATLLRAMPETGRTHQIRVHCQTTGHAILGDAKYTPKPLSSTFPRVASLCLHAARLSFEANEAGDRVDVEADLDPQFAALLTSLDSLENR